MEDLNSYAKYANEYSETGFFNKIFCFGKKIGLALVRDALRLYYVTKRPDCPPQVKAIIYGVLAYFVCPLDVIPDILPAVGYTDDAAIIVAQLAYVHMYINSDVKANADRRLAELFEGDSK